MQNSDSHNQTDRPSNTFASSDDTIYFNFDSNFENSEHEFHESGQQATPAQAFNESLIKLLVLLYQIDGKVTLNEQDVFEEITASLDWRSGVSLSAFINDAIHQARVAINEQASRQFMFNLGQDLLFNPVLALKYARDIIQSDGNGSDVELELLSLLSNRVLARGLAV